MFFSPTSIDILIRERQRELERVARVEQLLRANPSTKAAKPARPIQAEMRSDASTVGIVRG